MISILTVLSCLSLALARPDVSLGYAYNHPADYSTAGVVAAPLVSSSYLAPRSGASLVSSYGTGSGYGQVVSSGSGAGYGQVVSSGSGAGYGQLASSGSGAGYASSASFDQQAPLVKKYFFSHSAPEERAAGAAVKHITVGRPQKYYRVVFVKAPVEHAGSAHIEIENAPIEDNTAIYVLSKKPEEFRIEGVTSNAPLEPKKPDVHYLKYQTDDEALHAQHEIQARYDALGGSSQFLDEGTHQVQSVIGSVRGSSGGSQYSRAPLAGSSYNQYSSERYVSPGASSQYTSGFVSSGSPSVQYTSGFGSGFGSGSSLSHQSSYLPPSY